MERNYKSDFSLLIGNVQGDVTTPFTFTFRTFSSAVVYVASFDGVNYVNCRREADGKIMVLFDNHGLGLGELWVTTDYKLTNPDYPDGIEDKVDNLFTGVILTDGESYGVLDTVIYPDYQKGDKGDPLTWSDLTDDQKEQLARDASNFVLNDMIKTSDENNVDLILNGVRKVLEEKGVITLPVTSSNHVIFPSTKESVTSELNKLISFKSTAFAQDGGESTTIGISQKGIVDLLTANSSSLVSSFTNEDNAIKADLESEIKRSTDKDVELGEKLNQEIDRSTRKDVELGGEINAEELRATNKESEIAVSVEVERNRALAAEFKIGEDIGKEKAERVSSDTTLQAQISMLKDKPDVSDIVGTKQDLDNYDRNNLHIGNVIKVLSDETRGGDRTYYKYTSTSFPYFSYIGKEVDLKGTTVTTGGVVQDTFETDTKVDKEIGKSLMTDAEHSKLANLSNYDDSDIMSKVSKNTQDISDNKTKLDGARDDLDDMIAEVADIEQNKIGKTDLVQSQYSYPVSTPLFLGQDLIDSKKRFYKAAGTASLLDWEIVRNEGFTGVEGNISCNLSGTTKTFHIVTNIRDTLDIKHILNFPTGENFFFIYGLGSTRYYELRSITNEKLVEIAVSSRENCVFDVVLDSPTHFRVYLNAALIKEGDSIKPIYTDESQITNMKINPAWVYPIYQIRTFNFAATPAQVREWYNTGRVDRYELPAEFKSTPISDDIASINYTGDRITQIGIGTLAHHTENTVLSQLPDKTIRSEYNGTTHWSNRFLMIGFQSSFNLITSIANFNYRSDVPITIMGREYPATNEFKNISIPILNLDYTSAIDSYEVRVRYDSNSIVPGNYFEFNNLRIIHGRCLHEYKGSNIQPHKLVDTGATPIDVSLINGTTRTSEPTSEAPYQEYISGEGAPTIVPQIEQQHYEDLTNKNLYKSVGTSSATDWKRINN